MARPNATSATGSGGGIGGEGSMARSFQLYTVRDQLAEDLDGTLAALREIGYTRVEHAGFAAATAARFKAALDAAGLWASAGHASIPQPFDDAAWGATLDDANTLGSRFIVHPWFGVDQATGNPIRDAAPYQAFARDLNRAGRMAEQAGLRLGYHNHHHEFLSLAQDPARSGFDVLTAETDPDLVHLELDVYWAWRGARDPVGILDANPGRVPQLHIKDMNLAGGFTDPGEGLIGFARILDHADEAGVTELIVERDDAGSPPRSPADALTTATVGFRFLEALGR